MPLLCGYRKILDRFVHTLSNAHTINKNNDTLVYKKGTLLGYKSKTLRLAAIGCVSMSEGILFRDIIIETNGGQQIAAKGFLVSDAKQIVKILSDF